MKGSDDELVAQAVHGEGEALTTVLERYGPQVRRGLDIGKQWRSLLSVDDVMQVTYLEAFLRISDLREPTVQRFCGWLKRIAENNLRDAIKELSRQKRPSPDRRVSIASDGDFFLALYEQLGATSTTPSRVAASREARAALDSALKELPADYATVVRLYDLEGRSGPEVAETMGKSRGAVFMLRARAHAQLRAILGSGTKFLSSR